MGFLTIILFFICSYGLGFSMAKIARESENFLERNLMRVGIGLGSMIVLGLLLSLLRVPLDWRVFLGLSIIIPLFHLVKNANNIRIGFRLTKYDLTIIVMLLIFFASFYMYSKGAFSYPWLEDDDSWGHAIGAKYVALEKTAFADKPLRYIDPYPPAYDMLLGILHQSNDSLYWTLKFFNALIISLSIIFFFFFAKEIMDKNKALFATFALASIPAFLSHFIWAIALSIPLYFVALYCAERIRHDRKWVFIAAIMIGAVLTTSPSHSAYFGIFFIVYYMAKALTEKKLAVPYALAGIMGILVSFILWWIPAILKHGLKDTLKGLGSPPGVNVLTTAGTADRIYTLRDFIIAQKQNMINNPIGIGFVVSFLALFAILFLFWKYIREIRKNKVAIFILIILLSVVLFSLSQTYTKFVPKRDVAALPPGATPFFEFLSDQFFMVISLSVILILLTLIIVNHKTVDPKDGYLIFILAWLFFAFYFVNASPFYYKLTPFRVWSILAIPVAIIAAEGLASLMQLFGKFKISKFAVIIVVAAGILFTSAYQKYTVNTAQWPPGGFWTSYDEVMGYVWMKDNLEKNSNVFSFVNNGPVIGMDMHTCHWCQNIQDYQQNGFNQTTEQNYNWLKREKYRYIVIDGQTARKFGANETNAKVNEMIASNKFSPAFNNNGLIVLEIL